MGHGSKASSSGVPSLGGNIRDWLGGRPGVEWGIGSWSTFGVLRGLSPPATLFPHSVLLMPPSPLIPSGFALRPNSHCFKGVCRVEFGFVSCPGIIFAWLIQGFLLGFCVIGFRLWGTMLPKKAYW